MRGFDQILSLLPMSIQQTDIFGGVTTQKLEVRDVTNIIEKYPVTLDRPEKLYYYAAREMMPWLAQMPQERQSEFKAFCDSIENLRRRRQEYRASHT